MYITTEDTTHDRRSTDSGCASWIDIGDEVTRGGDECSDIGCRGNSCSVGTQCSNSIEVADGDIDCQSYGIIYP